MNETPIPETMRALHRTPTGVPVPWSTLWSTGTIRVTTHLGTSRRMGCDCTPGQGRPLFGQSCPARQRRAVAERRCGVCGTCIDDDAPVNWISATPGATFLEPGAHPVCLAFSMRTCPHLRHLIVRSQVYECTGYTVAECRMVPLGGTVQRVSAPLNSGDADGGVLEFYVPQPHVPRILGAGEWLARQARR